MDYSRNVWNNRFYIETIFNIYGMSTVENFSPILFPTLQSAGWSTSSDTSRKTFQSLRNNFTDA